MEFLLRKETLNNYNINECKNEINKIITEYIRIKYVFSDILKQNEEYYNSTSTTNLSERLEMPIISYRDKVSDKVEFKIDNEIEVIKINNDFEELYKKFTDIEKDYFIYVLLDKQAQRMLEDKYRITRTGLEPAKQSCILKSALHFGVAVKKEK